MLLADEDLPGYAVNPLWDKGSLPPDYIDDSDLYGMLPVTVTGISVEGPVFDRAAYHKAYNAKRKRNYKRENELRQKRRALANRPR